MYNYILQAVENRVQLLNKLEDLNLSSKSGLISLVESLTVSALRFLLIFNVFFFFGDSHCRVFLRYVKTRHWHGIYLSDLHVISS